MIPTLLLPGLILGRWWLVPIAAVAWPALLVADAIGGGWGFAVSAGALAAVNVAVAVAVHRGAVFLVRGLVRFLRDPLEVASGHSGDRRD